MLGKHNSKRQINTRKICVYSGKGGVGSSITAVNLANGLALAGFNVLLVDTDVKGHVAIMLGVQPQVGLAELISGEAGFLEATFQARERLSLLSGGKSLAAVTRFIGQQDYAGEKVLAEALAPAEKDFDFIIVDTSSGWDALTINILFYVDELLAPVTLDYLSTNALIELIKNISTIQKFRNGPLFNYVLPTFFAEKSKKEMEVLAELFKLYGDKVCDPVRHNESLSESVSAGQTVFEYAPGAHGADDYRSLVRKVSGDDKLFR